jgi:hypothetical protein
MLGAYLALIITFILDPLMFENLRKAILQHSEALAILAAVGAGLISPLLLKYLDSPSVGPPVTRQIGDFQSALAKISSDVAALKVDQPQVVGRSSLAVEELRSSITDELVTELENRLSVESMRKSKMDLIHRAFEFNRGRLLKEIDALGRRGNVNLVIGVVTTLLAAGLLAYLILNAPPFTTLTSVLSHYIPRISTVVFIEVFSFFFLRLYKSTLAETKYYQNELTTLAALEIAMEAAVLSQDGKVLAKVVESLSQTNRNFSGAPDATKPPAVNYKNVTDLLEKFAKIAVEASKGAKG